MAIFDSDPITKMLKRLTGRRIAEEPIASSTDTDDLAMQDDPQAQYILAIKKKRRTAMLKKMLEQGGMGDLSRIISVREK